MKIKHLFPPYKLPAEAATAIIVKNNKYLLLKRSLSSKTYKHFWQLPEGKIKKDEKPVEALKRELKEELDTPYKATDFIYIKKQRVYVKIFGLPIIAIDRYLFKSKPPKKITLSKEHLKYGYFSKKEIEKLPNKVPGLIELLE